MRVIYKQYDLCNDNTYIIDNFAPSELQFYGIAFNGLWTAPNTYATAPGWFGILNYGYGIEGWQFLLEPTVLEGTYVLSFSLEGGNELLIVINVKDDCSVPIISTDCCNSLNIVWLNHLGGYENFNFTGKRTIYEVNAGENETFKTYDMTLKNSQISDVYRAVVVNTGVIERSLLTKLESLKNSIQAWYYDETLPTYYEWAQRFTPIILDRESLIVNDTKEKIIERSVRFLIAKEVAIQTQ